MKPELTEDFTLPDAPMPDFGEMRRNIDDAFDDFSPNAPPVSGGSDPFPFQVVQTAPGEVKVRYGTVNSVAPAQVNPDLALATAFGSSPAKLWLAVSLDSTTQEVTSVTVQTGEPGANSPTSAKILIATISWSSGQASIGQNLSGSQQLVSCGSNHYWGRV